MRINTQLNGANFRPKEAREIIVAGHDAGIVHPDWTLEHDEFNAYDAYAVRIIDKATSEFIGFIARSESGVICKAVFLNKTHKVELIEIEGWIKPIQPVLVVTLAEVKEAPAEPVEHAFSGRVPDVRSKDDKLDEEIPF